MCMCMCILHVPYTTQLHRTCSTTTHQVRLSLWVHTPLVLYYLFRELRRECGFDPELLSLPFLKLRLSRLYEAIDWQVQHVE